MEPPSLVDPQQQHAFQMNNPQSQQVQSQQQQLMMTAPSVSIPSSAVGGGGGGMDAYDPLSTQVSPNHSMTRQQLQQQLQQQQQQQLQARHHAQQLRQQQQQQMMDPMAAAYAQNPYARDRTPTPPNVMMHHAAAPNSSSGTLLTVGGGVEQKAVHLLSACESCLLVVRVPGYDMSFRRVMEQKCPRCTGMLTLPQENMEMLILYGHFVAESVAATVVLGTMGLHPSLRADFVAAVMNELLIPLQTDFVYDIAVPKRQDGLGMSLRMHKGDLVVGGFIDFEDNTESPSVAARIIAAGDVLVAINKKCITASSFETNIRMLSHAASPVYLTFRRSRAVTLL
ncbi:hypothetical protein Gpo141_00005160 [Globisporangium polare]